jgi:hypothetical protein
MEILTGLSGIVLTASALQLLARGLTELAVDAGPKRLLENLVGD